MHIGRFHTRGRTNRLAFVRLMWIYVVLSSTCWSPDRQISDDLFIEKFVCPVCTSDDLFIWDDLSIQTICSPSSVKTAILFTLENKQIIWTDKLSGICPSDANLYWTVDDLFVLMGKSSWKNLFPDGQTSDDLFFEKFVRLHIRQFIGLRRFVRPDDLFVL